MLFLKRGIKTGPKTMEDARAELFRKLRRMVRDPVVIDAMERVPRERFVPSCHRDRAYENEPLPIGEGQTISQPLIVACMTSALELKPTDRVLEVGTGSGYQAAVLSLMVPEGEVVTVERAASLANRAAEALRAVGCDNVRLVAEGPGLGCPEEAPFDAIMVTAAGPRAPRSLVEQLAVGGRMIIPVGSRSEQHLVLVRRMGSGLTVADRGACRFVPLVGPEAWPAVAGPG